jgi:hypothetical protein
MIRCIYMPKGVCTNRLALPLYGARPSAGICAQCEHRNGLRGAGDAIKWLLSFTPLRSVKCGGCTARQSFLNKAMPSSGCGCKGAPKAADEQPTE